MPRSYFGASGRRRPSFISPARRRRPPLLHGGDEVGEVAAEKVRWALRTPRMAGDDVGEVELLGAVRVCTQSSGSRREEGHPIITASPVTTTFSLGGRRRVAVGVGAAQQVELDLAPLLVQGDVLVSVRVGSAGLRP